MTNVSVIISTAIVMSVYRNIISDNADDKSGAWRVVPSGIMEGIRRYMGYTHVFFWLLTVYLCISSKAIGIYRTEVEQSHWSHLCKVVTSKSQVIALKYIVKSQVMTHKSQVKSQVKTNKSQVKSEVLNFELRVLNNSWCCLHQILCHSDRVSKYEISKNHDCFKNKKVLIC